MYACMVLTTALVRPMVQALSVLAASVVMYTSNTLRMTCWLAMEADCAAMGLIPEVQLYTCMTEHSRMVNYKVIT